jgi:hypothetical protein
MSEITLRELTDKEKSMLGTCHYLHCMDYKDDVRITSDGELVLLLGSRLEE